MKNLEPVAVVNGSVSIVEAAIALGVGFGLSWTAEQVALVMALVIAIANLVKTFWARAQVTPVANPRGADNRALVAATTGS